MPAISLPHTLTVTVRLDPKDFMKIDKLAHACNRTRAGLLRELVQRSELTGQADVVARLVPAGAEDAS
jgi:predicted transcriptional regulator